jgi:hypothetical protein
MEQQQRDERGLDGLTCIPMRIHSGAAADEVPQAQITAFLDILAEIAMSIAKRTQGQGEEKESAS